MKNKKDNKNGSRLQYRLVALLIAFAMVIQPAVIHSFQSVKAAENVEAEAAEPVAAEPAAPAAEAPAPAVETAPAAEAPAAEQPAAEQPAEEVPAVTEDAAAEQPADPAAQEQSEVTPAPAEAVDPAEANTDTAAVEEPADPSATSETEVEEKAAEDETEDAKDEEKEEEEKDEDEDKESVSIQFAASKGGKISMNGGALTGSITQTIKKDEAVQAVVAQADEGYKFVRWAEGDATVTTDAQFVAPVKAASYTACFEEEYPAASFVGSANGVYVSVLAPAGALPYGTTMTVRGASAAAAEQVIENVEQARAVDITFWKDGIEIEPKAAVSVSMNASGMEGDSFKVVHVADNGAAAVVADGGDTPSAVFASADFSVYIVVGENDPDADLNAVATYQFYVGEELKSTQYVKDGEKLADPGPLAGDNANEVFLGWYVGDAKLNFDEPVTVEKTGDVRVDAKTQKTFYVTFLGEEEDGARPIAAVKTVTVVGDETGSVDPSEVSVIPKKDTSVFKGWSTTGDVADIVSGSVEVSDHMKLYAVIVHANWIRFDENDGGTGGGASYTGPVAVEDGQLPSAVKPADPTRKGYTFGGWFTDAECTTAFNWDQPITEETTLYAKWTPNENTTYTVIVWKQKVTDAKDAADAAKTYDYEEHHVLTGKTDADIVASMYSDYTGYSYTGFHFGRVEYDEKTIAGGNKIRAKGDTVINVYYDRNLNTINFVRRNGEIVQTMTGLYGQTLAQNGYTWPDDYDWYEGTTHVTFLDSFKYAETSVDLVRYQESSGWYYIRHYKQNIDGSYPNTPTNQTRSNGGTWTFTEKYDGFTCAQYRVGNGGYNSTSAGNKTSFDSDLYIRYSRNKYSLTFQDESGRITDSELAALNQTAIPYEQTLSSYQPSSPAVGTVVDHYVFQGWFEDASGTTEFDWSSTMPAANKVVYAKWIPETYHVTLDPDGGTLPQGQIAEFDLDYQEIISRTSLEQTTKVVDGKTYELIGWFDKDTGAVYGYPKVDKNTNLIAKWRFPGQVQIIYESEVKATVPVDEYRYATDSSVVVAAPPTEIEEGYHFYGWKIDGEGTTYYPNNTFDITDDLIKDYTPETKTGTITLVAFYTKAGEGPFEPTHINWYKNDGTKAFRKDGEDPENPLLVNQPVDIEAAPTRDGYVFLGWARVTEETDEEGKPIDPEYTQELGEDDIFIYYKDGKFYSDKECTKEAELVAGDEDRVYQAMFAVWQPLLQVQIAGNTAELPYNGTEQSADGFTVQYKVGDGEWTTTPPEGVSVTGTASARGTDVGTYPMNLTKDAFAVNPGSYSLGEVTVTDGSLKITPLDVTVTITGNKDSKEYNGSEQSVEGYKTEISDQLYTEADFTFSGEAVAKGTNVGTYPMGLTKDQFANTNTNFNVTFNVVDGELEITKPGQITVTITGNKESKVYNGSEQKVEGYTVSISDPLYKEADFTFSGEAVAKGTDVGKYPMGLAESQFTNNNDNFDVTFSVTDGELEITPKEVTVTITGNKDSKVYNGAEQSVEGYEVEISDQLYTEDDFAFDGTDVAKGTDAGKYPMGLAEDQFKNNNDNFTVTFNVTDGELEITPIDKVTVTITGHNNATDYDGEEHTVTGYDVEISNPLYKEADFTFSGTAEAKRTDAGQTDMGLAKDQFANTSKNFTEVTFEVTDGYQKINPITATVTITGHNNTATYDGAEHSVSGYDVEISNPLYKEADFTFSGTAEAKRTDAGQTDMGLAADQFTNNNTNFENVTFNVTDGYQKITPVDEVAVTITGHNNTTDYDGAEHSVSGYDVEISNPLYTVEDFTFSGTDEAKRTDAGKTDMGLAEDQFANTNENFAKVTFTVTDGYQEIAPINATVTITGHNNTTVYDGAEHAVTGYDVTTSTPLYKEADFTFSGTAEAKRTDAGQTDMGLAADQFKNDNTNFATVTFEVTDGYQKITPADISDENRFTVSDPEDTKYNGQEQKQPVTVTDEETGKTLAEGTDYDLAYEGEKGDVINVQTVTITVTGEGNYTGTITKTYKITKRDVTLTSASAEKVYDGTPLTRNDPEKDIEIGGDGFAEGEGATFDVTGSQTYVGSSENTFKYQLNGQTDWLPALSSLLLQAGGKATDPANYNIEVTYGTLTVTDDVPSSDVITKSHEGTEYAVGETIKFNITVTNIYDEAKDITIVEQEGVKITSAETVSGVAPGATATFTAEYTVTAEDAKAGSFKNTATAKFSGVDKDYPGDDIVPIKPLKPHITVVKKADKETAKLGDTITYTITVTNDGETGGKNITVKDDLTGDSWTIEALAVGESKTFTATHTVTADDVKAGKVVNTATATGETEDGDPLDVTPGKSEVPVDDVKGHITIVKTAGVSGATVGQTITYTIKVTNDGTIGAKDIVVTDDLTKQTWTIAALAPGASQIFTTSYKVTEADAAAKQVINNATATGKTDDPNVPLEVTPGRVVVPIGSSVIPPKTGDPSQMLLWAYTMIIAALGIVFMGYSRRRERARR